MRTCFFGFQLCLPREEQAWQREAQRVTDLLCADFMENLI
jgi:hypothetical protein